MPLRQILLVGLLMLAGDPQVVADEVLHIGSDKQLFMGPWSESDGRDEHLVARMTGITMTEHEVHVTGEQLEMPEPEARVTSSSRRD